METELWRSAAKGNFTTTSTNVIGIDLGTTNSCVALWSRTEDVVKIIAIDEQRTTPSMLHYQNTSSTPLVGHAAQKEAHVAPRSTLSNVKRFMGRTYPEIQNEALRCPFDVVPLDSSVDPSSLNPKQDVSKVLLHFQHKETTCELLPEEASALVLRYLRVKTEEWINDPENEWTSKDKTITAAVITVPARFGYLQRLATKRAASRAGFTEVRLVAEPTAAAMAYGVGVAGTKRVLVFDLGGGTFDVSILDVKEGHFKVIAMGGDEFLGGNDVDDFLVRHVLQRICKSLNITNVPKPNSRKQTRSSCSHDVQHLCQVLKIDMQSSMFASFRKSIEEAKITASDPDNIENNQVELLIDLKVERNGLFLPHVETMVLNITTDIENVVQPLIRETIQIVKDVVQRAMDKEDDDKSKSVNEVILVGGPTRMPCVRRALASEFPSVVLCKDINPDEVVAEGAAIQAAVLSGVSHNILKEILLMDVLPMSIGVSAGNGNFISIVPRNANIPCTRSKSFFTAVDNQKGITVQLYEGEHQLAKDNQYLTKFNFPIPKTRRGKAGQVKVTVTFSIGAGGMIRVETDADEENKADENKHQMMLMFFIFILMGMLFFLRMNPAMFKDKVDQWEQHRQTIDGVDGLPAIDGFDEFNVPDGGSSVGSVNVDSGGVKSNIANGVPSVAEL
tara:strand:- start:1971 stop:3995 length:2025 start_codon:yes stop_codon:yes gene_type:complete